MNHTLEKWFTDSAAGVTSRPNIVLRCGAKSKAAGNFRALSGGVVLLLALSLRFSAQLAAQQTRQISYEGQMVALVDFVARPNTKIDYLRHLVQQKAGEPYSDEKIQNSIKVLEREGHFAKVAVRVTPEVSGLRVAFILEPGFYIGMIYFPGALRVFSYPNLLQVVNYPSQEQYDESRVAEAQQALVRYFARNGYFLSGVQVETKVDDVHKLVNLLFHVTLNKRAKFGTVRVVGPPPQVAASIEQSLRSIRARLKGAFVKSGKRFDPKPLSAARSFIRDDLGRHNRLAGAVRLNPPHYNPDTNRADVSFQVTLGPTVAVSTVGAKVSKRTLRRLIPIFEENTFDQDLVEEGERNLVAYFQDKGYFDVKVDPKVQEAPSEIVLRYQIDRGRRHRVSDVGMRGNHHFSGQDLLPVIQVKKGGLLSRGRFSNDLLNRSVQNLTAYYRNAGFQDVKVQPNVVDREGKVAIIFEVTEGPRTIVNALNVEGNKTQLLSRLAPHGLKLAPGKPYSQQLLNQDRDRIMATYLDRGYLSAFFTSSLKPAPDDPHHFNVTYTIQEGPQTRISEVIDVGAQHTRRDFIDSTADIAAGRPLSQGKLLESESRLYNTGVFDWVSVGTREQVTDQTEEEVLVKVHDAKRNSLIYGVGFELSSRTGNVPAGTVALPGLPIVPLPGVQFSDTQKLFASPRGSIEYTRHDLRGRGETASISALVARLDQRGAFTYADPHFRGVNWSALLSASGERTSENPLFTARLADASFQVERPLRMSKTQRVQFRYRFQRTTLTNLLIPELVLPQDRSVHLSTLSASYIRDTRDKPLDAHRGFYQTLDLAVTPKVIGSSDNFTRFFGQTAYYRQIKPSLVWANNVRLGLAKPFAGSEVPLSERFFSGGADSLRGFPVNGAGPQRPVVVCGNPQDTSTCTRILVPVGGNQLFIINSEARFPIPVRTGLGGVFFYDGGNVYNRISFRNFFNDYSNTIGFGVRYQTPVGPVRIDVGRNLSPLPGIKATQIFVSLGQAF